MRYLPIWCLLAMFVGCPNLSSDGDLSRGVIKATAKARRAADLERRSKQFKDKLVNAHQFFMDGLAEENHMKLETAGKSLSAMRLTQDLQERLEADHQGAIERVKNLGQTISEFAGVYQQTMADRKLKAAGFREYLKEEDLIPKIEEIKNMFQELNQEFELGLEHENPLP